MKKAKFILLTLALALGLVLVSFLIKQFEFSDFSLPAVVTGILVSALGGVVSYMIIARGLKKEHKQFFSGLIQGMVFKLLIGLVAVAIVVLMDRSMVSEFVVSFFLSYFVFTSFEVYSLMRSLRPENQKPSEVAENIKVSGQNESKT